MRGERVKRRVEERKGKKRIKRDKKGREQNRRGEKDGEEDRRTTSLKFVEAFQ